MQKISVVADNVSQVKYKDKQLTRISYDRRHNYAANIAVISQHIATILIFFKNF